MDYLEELRKYNYERLFIFQERSLNLVYIVCVHNRKLGPALGGLRYREYKNIDEAIVDVLRLARGMTYKSAAAGLKLGGGKSVLMKLPNTVKSEELLLKIGEWLESISGVYITAEDVGTTVEDMATISKKTKYVAGLKEKSGDPSPITALGVHYGLKAAVKFKLNKDNLDGLKVLIQGVGHVGTFLASHLAKENVQLYYTDINKELIDAFKEKFPQAHFVESNDIWTFECDVFSPCAIGAILNDETIKKLAAPIVVGSANNQLERPEHAKMLKDRGILYAPDFIVNAGGIINVYREVANITENEAIEKTKNIYNTLMKIFEISENENITTHEAAESYAQSIIGEKDI